MIDDGFMLDPELRPALSAWLGRELLPDVWRHCPTGHRILVVPTPSTDTYKGLIVKPRSVQEREAMEAGSGCIIGVGPRVGKPGAPHPVGVECEDPRDLLGQFVIFRKMGGVNIETTEEDSEFGGKHALLMLTDRDILLLGERLVLSE